MAPEQLLVEKLDSAAGYLSSCSHSLQGGMLLVLMMAHMASHEYMRARLQTVLLRRVHLQAALDALLLPFPQDLPLQKPLS